MHLYRSQHPGFEAVAQQIIAAARQKNHHVLASDLQRILANGSAPHSLSAGVGGWQNGRFHPLPRNSEEESGLLEIRQPERYWPKYETRHSGTVQKGTLEIKSQRALDYDSPFHLAVWSPDRAS